jgi:hypothetical protein
VLATAPGAKLSATIATFSAALQRRRRGVPVRTSTRRKLCPSIGKLLGKPASLPRLNKAGSSVRLQRPQYGSSVSLTLNTHSATDVLLFALAHPRWEFVFQPVYAAYLNLIEPWWKVLRSLALKGRRFETWPEIEEAVRRATEYWNAHKHPFIWGRRRRHRTPRRPGVAIVPNVATT